MRYRLAPLAAAALLSISMRAAPASGSAAGSIDQVEEDWQLVVSDTDLATCGPQVTTWMSPGSGASDPFVVFNLNYRDQPSFQPGGVQVQAWQSDRILGTGSSGTAQLETAGETITWTQRMSLSAGSVCYRVVSGQSTTWGAFGGGDDLLVSVATALTDLSGYDPAASLSKSGVGWQADHVTSMTLVAVRYYSAGQLVRTDTTSRSVPLP